MEEEVRVREVLDAFGNRNSEPVRNDLRIELEQLRSNSAVGPFENELPRPRYGARIDNPDRVVVDACSVVDPRNACELE